MGACSALETVNHENNVINAIDLNHVIVDRDQDSVINVGVNVSNVPHLIFILHI